MFGCSHEQGWNVRNIEIWSESSCWEVKPTLLVTGRSLTGYKPMGKQSASHLVYYLREQFLISVATLKPPSVPHAVGLVNYGGGV